MSEWRPAKRKKETETTDVSMIDKKEKKETENIDASIIDKREEKEELSTEEQKKSLKEKGTTIKGNSSQSKKEKAEKTSRIEEAKKVD